MFVKEDVRLHCHECKCNFSDGHQQFCVLELPKIIILSFPKQSVTFEEVPEEIEMGKYMENPPKDPKLYTLLALIKQNEKGGYKSFVKRKEQWVSWEGED